MAGKKALWRFEGGSAKKAHPGDCSYVLAEAQGLTAACREEGLLASRDGEVWKSVSAEFSPAESEADKGIPLNRLLLDIHTGRVFFGKQYAWIWIDLLGLAIVGLGLTGLTMWARGRRRRVAAGRRVASLPTHTLK
jgi:hypothetical protein